MTLVVAIALFALLFSSIGFRTEGVRTRVIGVSATGALVYKRLPPPNRSTGSHLVEATIFSAATATAVVGTPERPLTRTGNVLRIVLRVLGPVLVGLGLLSLRGRVKH